MAEITHMRAVNIHRQFLCYHHCREYSLLGSKFSTKDTQNQTFVPIKRATFAHCLGVR